MNAGSPPRLTDKQSAVMERIDRRVPIKVIAADLDVSESRINQHVRKLKDAYGAADLGDLVNKYRAYQADENGGNEPFEAYRKPAYTKSQLPESQHDDQIGERADPGEFVFSDALTFDLKAPWNASEEPEVVPGVLDGDQAIVYRLAVMIGIAFGLVAAVILVVTASVSMTEALDGKARIPAEKIQPAD